MRFSATRIGKAPALQAGEGKVEPAGDAALEHGQMIRQSEHRLDHVQIIDAGRIKGSKAGGEQISLLLIVPLDHHAIAALDDGVQQADQVLRRTQLAAGQTKRPSPG
jgi:hypothetical protein